MKRHLLHLLLFATSAALSHAQTVGQYAIPKWTSGGLSYKWLTPVNGRFFGIDGSSNPAMLSGGGGAGLDNIASTITGETLTFGGTLTAGRAITWRDVAGTVALTSDLSSYLTTATAATSYQPLDSDLTSIAALTTSAHGRSLLTGADAAATRVAIGLSAYSSTGFALGGTATIADDAGNITLAGTLDAVSLSGDGSAISALNGSNISSGTVAAARLGSGSSISTKFLRGDNTWQPISGGGDALTSGTLAQFAATTSAQLRGVLSDESGTGEFLTTSGNGSALTGLTHTQISGLGTLATQNGTISDYLTIATAASTYQPLDADLTTYAGITPSANVQSLLGAADYAAMRSQLGLVIGTNVQAYDADLTTYAGITPAANVQSLLGAADYAAMRSQLGLVIGTNVQAYDADLTTYAGITPSANVQSLLGAADYAAMRSQLGLVIGTNVQAYDADLDDLADGSLTGTLVAAASTSARGTVELATDGEASASVAVQGNDTRLVNAGKVEIGVAISDETTALTTGTAKLTFRMPHAMTLTAVRLSLTTVSSSGTPTVDINEAGASVLSTKLSCDASEKTSTTAATAAVISDSSLADDAEITIDIDTAGTGATGAKVWLIGTR